MPTINNHMKPLAGPILRGGTRWIARRSRTAVASATLLAIVALASVAPGVTRAQALASAPLTGTSNPLCFNPPVTTPMGGTAPVSIAVVDLDGDGKSDLAVANQDSNDVGILHGNGDGTFQSPSAFITVGNHPTSIAVGDFDGNGRPDLAVANQGSNNVSILLSSGGGFFFALTPEVSVGFYPSSVAASDVNGDGKLDLTVADQGFNSNTANVAILLGNGDATFQPAQFFGVGTSPTSVAVADWNGDHKPDLAVANGGSNNGKRA